MNNNEILNYYNKYKDSDSYKEREKQIEKFVPLAREIIIETINKSNITTMDLTGLIQMFGNGSSINNFNKYLDNNVTDRNKSDLLKRKFEEIQCTGFTGRGLNSISYNLSISQLEIIKKFLLDASIVDNRDDALRLYNNFQIQGIPEVKEGIYTPWLYYLNPKIFPIKNGAIVPFLKRNNIGKDYEDIFSKFHEIKNNLGIDDFGFIDGLCYYFLSDQPKKFWRIGTSIGSTNYWDSMRNDGKVIIAWGEIGDLSTKNIQKKEDISQLLQEKNLIQGNKATISRKAGEIYNFYLNIKIGDIILAQEGQNILGIGIVESNYQYDYSQPSFHQRKIEWIDFPTELHNKEGLLTTVFQLKKINSSLINYLIPIQSNQSMEIGVDIYPLNQILYGPPGTGKTYNTINKALEILEVDLEGKEREEIKEIFNQKVKEGRIVFTTFHQSMSYEDFIEGIKPFTENNTVIYEIQNGIFKSISNRALYSLIESNNLDSIKKYNNFDDLFNYYLENLGDRLLQKSKENSKLFLPMKTENKFIEILYINDTSIVVKGENAENSSTIERDRLRLLYNRFQFIDEIKNVNNDIRSVGKGLGWSGNYYGVFKDFKEFEKNISNQIINNNINKDLSDEEINEFLKSNQVKSKIKSDTKIEEPFVLIIDEINRGNVSQIFGELITLIEEDKRMGKEEELEIILPYSKETFSVPPNLYIIGTMNTADRSVEALDTALRRRFHFEEMPPIPSKIKEEGEAPNGMIEDIDLVVLLETINKRIEKLLNKDHLIGHSYFMKLITIEDLQIAFQNKIIPLLQEYFFGDYGKIGLVLGSGFLYKENENSGIFAMIEDYDDSVFDKVTYKLNNLSKMEKDKFKEAIKILIGK